MACLELQVRPACHHLQALVHRRGRLRHREGESGQPRSELFSRSQAATPGPCCICSPVLRLTSEFGESHSRGSSIALEDLPHAVQCIGFLQVLCARVYHINIVAAVTSLAKGADERAMVIQRCNYSSETRWRSMVPQCSCSLGLHCFDGIQ